MIMDSLDEYLETVAGYIFDNDKLVTYKWLSKELEVHVNVAKQILWEFRQRNKGEKNFDSTFLLMGTLNDGGMRVEVVKEKDLSTAKEKFTKVVSEHIYSLQKVLPEIQVLGLAENGDVKYSAIKCIENNERSDEDMLTLRWGIASKEMQCQEKTKLPEPAKEEEVKSPKNKPNDAKKDNQKKGYDNLFGKVSNKQKSPSSSSSSSSSNIKKMEVDTSNPKKQTSAKQTVSETSKKGTQKGRKKGGLSSFLQPSKNQEKSTKTVSLETSKSNNSVVIENTKKEDTVDSSNKQKENIVESSNIQKENTVESSNKQKKSTVESSNKQKKNARGKKRNRSKEANAATKKRKRITIQSDSSDTGSSDEEQEDEKEPSPSPEKVSPVRVRSPSPPKVKHEGGKCKVLKLVDKTFEEDGYLVTKKVHVYESCSEEEAEAAKPKKSVTPESRAETKGKKNTKQTTLMNFFKKS